MEQYERNVTAYIGRGVDGCEVDEHYALDNADIRVVLADGFVNEPLKHVILQAL